MPTQPDSSLFTLALVDDLGLAFFGLIALVAAGGALVFAIFAMAAATAARDKAERLKQEMQDLRAEWRAANRPAPAPRTDATPAPAEEPDAPKRAALGRLMTPAPITPPEQPAAEDVADHKTAEQYIPAPPAPHALEPTQPRPQATAPPRSFEELLGAKLFVWIGGVALVAAVAFLLKWTFDQNLITPGVRVIGGALFGLAMLGTAEFLRPRAAIVAQALSGAGLAALYAVIFAAANLYSFTSQSQGFVLSIAVTALAIALSLRHGVFTAVLGLLGGFVMPILLRTGEPVGGGFFAYLVLLQAGLLAVARHRRWIGLDIAALVGGGLWMLLSLAGAFPIVSPVWVAILIIGTAVVFVAQAVEAGNATNQAARVRWVLALTCSAYAAVMLAIHVAVQGFEPRDVWTMVAVCAAAVALARADRRYLLLPWIALFASLALFVGWAGYEQWLAAPTDIDPTFAARFTPALLAMAAVFWLGGYASLWKHRHAGMWACLSGAAALAWTLLAVLALWDATAEAFPWWAVVAGVTGVMTAMTAARHRATRPTHPAAHQDDAPSVILATFTAALAAGSIGLALYDQPPWLGIGWAALLLALAVARDAMRMPGLRPALAGVLGLTAITFLASPGPFFSVTGNPVLWNTLLPAYLGPAALLAAAAYILRRRDTPMAATLQAATLLTTLLGCFWLTRHAFAPHEPLADPTMFEAATHTLYATVLGLATFLLSKPLASSTLHRMGAGLTALGLVGSVLFNGLIYNPLWNGQPVGDTAVLNGLLLLYALPLLLAVASAKLFARLGDEQSRPLAAAAGVVALVMTFAWVSLCVRHGFAGSVLDLGDADPTRAELYAYSTAWVALGLTLLGLGVGTGSRTLRIGSLVVMLLAVGKVFLFDAAALRDLYRVLSFLGLGISLVGLGYIYQRWVFKREPTPAADASG